MTDFLRPGTRPPGKPERGEMPDAGIDRQVNKTTVDRVLDWCGDRAATGRSVAYIWGSVLFLVWLMRSFLFPAAGPPA